MAHNLSMGPNGVEMFYYGDTPWHKLGTQLNRPATAIEAIKAAKLDWKVELAPMYEVDPFDDKKRVVPFGKVVRRADNRAMLGMVGNDWRPLQNSDAFAFFDSVVGEKRAIYHTAGALGQGEKIWILAKLPGDIHITDQDNVERYLLLVNPHTGRASWLMYFTPIRVVCQNTLIFSAHEASNVIRVRHVGDVQEKVEKVREALGIVDNWYTKFASMAGAMVDRKLTQEELKGFFGKVILGPASQKTHTGKAANLETYMAKQRMEIFTRLFENGKGNQLPKVRGSLWAAVNAVSEYADHYQQPITSGCITKEGEMTELGYNKRLKSSWFGIGARLKERAFAGAVQLITTK